MDLKKTCDLSSKTCRHLASFHGFCWDLALQRDKWAVGKFLRNSSMSCDVRWCFFCWLARPHITITTRTQDSLNISDTWLKHVETTPCHLRNHKNCFIKHETAQLRFTKLFKSYIPNSIHVIHVLGYPNARICVQTRPWQVGTPFSHQPAQQCYLPGGFKPSRMVWFDGRFQQQMSNWENMGYSCNSLNCDN